MTHKPSELLFVVPSEMTFSDVVPPEMREAWANAKNDLERSQILNKMARYSHQYSLHDAIELNEASLAYAMQAADPNATAHALLDLAFVCAMLAQQVRAFGYIRRAKEVIEEHKLEHRRPLLHNTRALVRAVSGDETGARRDLHQVLALAHLSKTREHELIRAQINLASLWNSVDQPNVALHHLHLLSEILAQLTDHSFRIEILPYMHENRAHSFLLLIEQARQRDRQQAMLEAISDCENALEDTRIALLDRPNRTIEMLYQSHMSALNLIQGDIDAADRYAQEALKQMGEMRIGLYPNAHIRMAELHVARQEWPQAQEQYRQALKLAHIHSNHRKVQSILEAVAQMHEQLGEYREALEVTREALRQSRHTLAMLNEAQATENEDLTQEQREELPWQERLKLAEQMARQDPLTGLLNRRGLDNGLLSVSAHKPLVAAFLDLDHFKHINDNYSHDIGDKVLIAAAQLLSEQLPLNGALLARWGGEEFVMIITELDQQQVFVLLEKCRLALLNHNWKPLLGQTVVTVSVGYAWGLLSNLEEVLAKADEYLYLAKQEGRNRVYPILH